MNTTTARLAVEAELGVLAEMVDALARLDPAGQRRALVYLAGRFHVVLDRADVRVLASLDELVNALTARRYVLGLSQTVLAEKVGTVQSAVSEWETGKSKPGGPTLFAIADVLGCDLALVPRGDVWERAAGESR